MRQLMRFLCIGQCSARIKTAKGMMPSGEAVRAHSRRLRDAPSKDIDRAALYYAMNESAPSGWTGLSDLVQTHPGGQHHNLPETRHVNQRTLADPSRRADIAPQFSKQPREARFEVETADHDGYECRKLLPRDLVFLRGVVVGGSLS